MVGADSVDDDDVIHVHGTSDTIFVLVFGHVFQGDHIYISA